MEREQNYKKMAGFLGVVWKKVDKSPGSITCFSVSCFSHLDYIVLVGIAASFFVKCGFSFKVAEKKKNLNT